MARGGGLTGPGEGAPEEVAVAFIARLRFRSPAPEVFAALTDWPRQSAWVPASRVRRLPGPVAAAGERIIARSGYGPLAFDDPMTVREFTPPAPRGRPGEDSWADGVAVLDKTGAALGGGAALTVRDLGPRGRDGYRSAVSWQEHLLVRPDWLRLLARHGGSFPSLAGRAAFTAVLLAARRELDA